MRESRSSGSVEGVMGNHDSYSDSFLGSFITPREDPRGEKAGCQGRACTPEGFALRPAAPRVKSELD
jgi:hypothetical protein